MAALKWTTGMMAVAAVMVVTLALLTSSSSANLLNSCRFQCREEEEMKAACSEERACISLLPDLGAMVDCMEPCANIGTNCFQRCAFKTDRISAICALQCVVADPAAAVPAGSSGAPVGGNSAASQEGGSLCYKACYDSLLNDAMNRLYRKRP